MKKSEKLRQEDLKVLEQIINNPDTADYVKINAIREREKIVNAMEKETSEEKKEISALEIIARASED